MDFDFSIARKDVNKLLVDHTTGSNIIWATDDYMDLGEGYSFFDCIKEELVFKESGCIIAPRIKKTEEEQLQRVRNKAEVFTPSWMCNQQINEIDNKWFKRKNVFNIENGTTWRSKKHIKLKPNEFERYISQNRLEISCGEAPYITSRYDTVSGFYIDPINRIGLLDRKLKIINQEIDDSYEWINAAKTAMKSIYAYEWQGDNLFLARQNISLTIKEFYLTKFNQDLDDNAFGDFLDIISWNVFQMDGIKFVVPCSCHKTIVTEEFDLFTGLEKTKERECDGCRTGDYKKHNGQYCIIMDWDDNKQIRFVDLLERKDSNGRQIL